MAVSFHIIPPLPYKLENRIKLKRWIKSIVDSYDKSIGDISIVLCTDEYLYQINVDYLKHSFYTDIITFDNSDDPNCMEGDIFISVNRVAENALKYGVTTEEELRRVMAHGILHLLGYKDKKPEEQELMRQKENECLQLFNTLS